MNPFVKVVWAAGADVDIALPSYETPGAAGADIRANFGPDLRAGGLSLAPGARALIPAGFHVELPPGFEMQIRPRSGLAHKHGVTLTNAPGTVDADYRGPVGVLMINLGDQDFHINHGDRIAQAVIAPVIQARFCVVDTLDETTRGAGGFGSTGRT